MTHISFNYASKLAIAERLAELGGRAVTMTAVAKTRPADSRAIYTRVNGHQSQSGQTPKDTQWFLATVQRRTHAAFLLLTYANYRQRFSGDPDGHGLAFATAFRFYLRSTNNAPVISLERFNLLTSGFDIGWKDILKGGSSKFSSENVKVLPCRVCQLPHLVEDHFRKYECPKH